METGDVGQERGDAALVRVDASSGADDASLETIDASTQPDDASTQLGDASNEATDAAAEPQDASAEPSIDAALSQQDASSVEPPDASTASTDAGVGSPDASVCAASCSDPVDCPAPGGECAAAVCVQNCCALENVADGVAVMMQMAGDCLVVLCDGAGGTRSAADDLDVPADQNECNVGACANGVPVQTHKPAGTPCSSNGGTSCDANGNCFGCQLDADCPPSTPRCSANHQCVQCLADADCSAVPGATCDVAAGTCLAPPCANRQQDFEETDVDCGGPTCSKCASGKRCLSDRDCVGAMCSATGVCTDRLVISQVQTRGDNGGNDEFVELYNPTPGSVVFDSTWVLKARSANTDVTQCGTTSLATRFSGGGQTIPPSGHILFANSTVPAYNGAVSPDGTFSVGIPDAASVVLYHGNMVIDSVCFSYDTTTQTTLTTCSVAYICEGAAAQNPHNNQTSSNTDASLERKPGGSAGNGQDTGDSSADFATATPSVPRNLASPPAP
ncbi:MAG: hypothetical protein QM765_13730 [Myxococcales bacterium]